MIQKAIVGTREQVLAALEPQAWARRTMFALRRTLASVPPILNAVDMSKWGGMLTEAEARAMIARGVRLLIVGTGNSHPGGAGEWARQQGAMWQACGGELLDAYIYLYFAGDAVSQVAQGILTLEGVTVRKWWLDAEDIDPACQAMSVSARITFLRSAEIAAKARVERVGVYSGGWWWRPYMANSTAFAHLTLWDSYYPYGADENHVILVPWAGREYGGFADPEIIQFRGTYVLDGQSVDLDAADLGEEESMALKDQMERLLVGDWGAQGEKSMPWADRVARADYRLGQALNEEDDATPPNTYLPLAARAIDLDGRLDLLEEAFEEFEAQPSVGTVPKHIHRTNAGTTGEVVQA